MNNLEKRRNIEIGEIIAVIRLLFLFLFLSSIYTFLPSYYNGSIYGSSILIIFLLLVSLIIYRLWGYFLRTSVQTMEIRARHVICMVLEILMLTFIVYMTGAHDSRYKNLYFLAIITNAIRFGSRMGVISSLLSAVGIIFNDLILQLHLSENNYLEADLIAIITFFITGWTLGKYVENEIKYRKKLSQKVITDEVTGLYNHRYLQERLDIEVEEAKKNNYTLALIMIDLDYFKHYNDTFGHQEGDLLLKDIGGIIQDKITGKGIVCRYGGDEFTVILQNTRVEEALSIAEEIRAGIDGYQFSKGDDQIEGDLTASLGIAVYPQNAINKDELIKKADDAMYKAKFMSKNRVELYSSVLDDLDSRLNESEQELLNSIKTLVTIINAKDNYTYGHSERVVLYATMIGQAIGMQNEELCRLRYAAYLHDIGKIEISREILNKEDMLTEDEWRILKNHPAWGAEIIRPIHALDDIIPAVLYHHERFDGWGYPDGLKGYDIPLHARILAVADSFDAMMSERPYKEPKSFEEAVEELDACNGTQFDPNIVEKFIKILLTTGKRKVIRQT